MEQLISCYVGLVREAAPYAFAFWICDMIVTTLMSAINGGFVRVGRVR